MPLKQTKAQEKNTINKKKEKSTINKTPEKEDKCVLLRDLSTQMLLIVHYNDISTSKSSKIGVGTEVMYVVTGRTRGRGTVLIIGTDEECKELLNVLEKEDQSKNDDGNRSTLVIHDNEEKSNSESEGEELGSSTNDEENSMITMKSTQPSNIDNSKTSPSMKSSAEKNKRPLPFGNKSLNKSDENSPASKRLKVDDKDTNKYLRARITTLQEEKKKLQQQLEEMQATWMPRPDLGTIAYLSRVVSICTDADNDFEDGKGDKLIKIMTTLALSEPELDRCTEPKSIRSTCRKVVRIVFKDEFDDPDQHFGTLLKKAELRDKFAAIRSYGRLMHPAESLKFTDGELNNAMGSDFYQRDRNLKQQKLGSNENTGDDVEDDEGNN